ncbi:RWD domain-containing protein 4-like [Mizuhopecten yessoensis]|uniref:RWD domain-containing protein 4 n=1 Tax=Mizuhopecten yessoensis TaxID=6573 RepID=A0A210Q6D7_MIZYE|nr:RWD domain-containing protein 4-like [Mizuhopecten yessoensis]OWF44307.1 RWD domain-containing protein 4 [Mizuhopecten yessoensis]
MSCKEQQEEELEVLHSIYEGDEAFKEVSPTTFQYKYGEEGSYKTFNVEIVWDDNYPEESPTINLDTFYNKHILNGVKEKILSGLQEQVPDLLECAMTFTLFEWVKENYEDLVADQPDSPCNTQSEDRSESNGNVMEQSKKKERKEQFTKNQKRRMYEKLNSQGDLPRGHDWMDIIRHLSQTGGSFKD